MISFLLAVPIPWKTISATPTITKPATTLIIPTQQLAVMTVPNSVDDSNPVKMITDPKSDPVTTARAASLIVRRLLYL